jgi:hypothetical protein
VDRLLNQEPRSDYFRSNLSRGLLRRGQALLAKGELARAVADWRRALAISDEISADEPERRFVEACCQAMLASVAGQRGSGMQAIDGPIAVERAMDLLRRTIVLGNRNRSRYRSESALASLRGRADFDLLTLDLVMPADAFAPNR